MSTAALSGDNTPVDPDDELLVAYLDGELGRDDQTELENRLLEDETLRQRLQQLQTGWDWLDDLPDPAPSLKLVESTLELAVSEIALASPKSESLWDRYRFSITLASICLLAVLASVGAVAWLKHRAYQQQLADLAIVENLEAYNHGSNLELMRQLSANPDWIKMVDASLEMGDIQIDPIANLAATPLWQREELVRELPQKKIDQLNARWGQFERLDKPSRERIRQTAQAVSQQPDSEYLLKTMQAYAVWRDRLPPELRDQIEKAEGKERRDAVHAAIERTQLSISKRSSMKLDDNAIEWIYFALRKVVRQRIENGDALTTKYLERNTSNSGTDISEFRTIAAIVGVGRGGSRGGRGGGRGGGGRPFIGWGGDRPPPLQSYEIEIVAAALPNEALDILDSVAGRDQMIIATTIGMWAEEAVRRKSPFKREDLTPLERYRQMDDRDRDVLDLLPREELLRELSPDERRFRTPPPR